jgi:hypothetical protein
MGPKYWETLVTVVRYPGSYGCQAAVVQDVDGPFLRTEERLSFAQRHVLWKDWEPKQV